MKPMVSGVLPSCYESYALMALAYVQAQPFSGLPVGVDE